MNGNNLRCVLDVSICVLVFSLTRPAGAIIVPGDFDHDCDVDSADFEHFRTCALGMGVAQTNPLCANALLDVDADVDLNDFGIFQRCYSGENVPADPNCNHTCVGPDCNCVCGQTNCAGTCTSTASDEANCGTCGNTCATGLTCQNGSCAPSSCGGGLTFCYGLCRDLQNENTFCGTTCENAVSCPFATACTGGHCEPF
jgi:hypothetical protein